MKKQSKGKWEKNHQSILSARDSLLRSPLFAKMRTLADFDSSLELPMSCWAQIHQVNNNAYGSTRIYFNYRHNLMVEEWQYVMAQALLHLGLNHVQPEYDTPEGRVACELYTRNYLHQLDYGVMPERFREVPHQADLPLRDEKTLKHFLSEHHLTTEYQHLGIGGEQPSWVIADSIAKTNPELLEVRENAFAEGLKESVREAVEKATGAIKQASSKSYTLSDAVAEANQWVVSSFPLLSALAASFTIIEDANVCQSMQVEIAAVNPALKEVYLNPSPRWSFTVEEWTFILLHEFLHVGLRHDVRQQARDPYYWNVACDYVINGWLVEMGVGKLPQVGMLYDAELKGRSAEDIYDELVKNIRWQRRLAKMQTPRGGRLPDIIKDKPVSWWSKGEGVSLDEYYRSCLMQGLDYEQQSGRGLVPAGLVEEIKAINQRPIPWDVELTKWLDEFFPAIERRRTYSRMSRRQSATPDIARPLWHRPEYEDQTRTFGVILDTSGSMSRRELAMALGAISSYAQSREVRQVRLVYCDATPYDAGYIEAETLLDRVEIKGRGGTVLQPAIDLLQKAEDFPTRGPLLIITDGGIEHDLRVRMEHAYLMSQRCRLPFKTASSVFYFSE